MRLPRVLVSLFAASLAALAVGLAAAPAGAQPFPRLGLYGSVLGGGFPYVHPDFTLDTLEIAHAARFNEVVLDVYPISPYRPDIVEAMKARNPSLKVLAYLLAEDIWLAGDADSTRHIPTIIRHTVRDLDGFLYDKSTGGEYNTIAINIAKKDASGRFVVADAMADICRDHVIATRLWDGIFTDIFCHTVSWTQNGTSRLIDFQRAGYASLAELDVAWAAACDTLATRLRAEGGPGFVLVGNCGPSSNHERYNGWMRENFPFQQGGSWYANMLGDASSRGYLADDRDYVQPANNWVLSAGQPAPATADDPLNLYRARYGLASAALGEGVAAICPGKSVNVAAYQDWWYDEYAVDLGTGQSSDSQANTGWLGQPLGPAHTMLWIGSGPDAVTNSGFDSDVTSDWTFAAFTPAVASLSHDVSTAAVGTASARVSISSPGSVEWHVYLSNAGQMSVLAGSSYSATFWCRANPPRLVHVVTGNSGGSAYVAVDTTWRQYQVVLQPTRSMSASLAFFLGLEAGDVWLDDVHFQAGVSSVWRRDFQNGIVLVHPTEQTLNVALEGPFRRILGVHAPAFNDGTVAPTMVLGPNDGVFLLRAQIDRVRPAAVTDLRVGP